MCFVILNGSSYLYSHPVQANPVLLLCFPCDKTQFCGRHRAQPQRQRQATKLEYRRIETELLQLETTRIETQKFKIRSATTKRLTKERSEIARNLPQKQSHTKRQRTHRALQAELHLRVEQHARAVATHAKQKEEQSRVVQQQALKQHQDNQELLIR